MPAEFPSLLWLVGEDSVDKESFYRVCDRSFMLLQLQKLLKKVEEARRRPWAKGRATAAPEILARIPLRSTVAPRS